MLYKFSEPYRAYLYFPYLIDFKKELQGLLESFGMPQLDYTDIILTVSETLDQIHLPDFVVRFDTWLKNQSQLNTDRYISYFKNNDNSWKPGIRGNNKFIDILSLNICASTISNINCFLKRLSSDHTLLTDYFNCPPLNTPGKLAIAAGDRHNNGEQPVILTLGKFSIVYKPRDSGIENTLNNICDIITLRNVCPKTLSMGTHLWQSFIENRELASKNDAKDVYRKYGNILALVDLLNINDCHFDNFIVDANNVWLIDPETSFQYFFDDGENFERSIYQTGLLQSPDVISNGLGHTSALTAVTSFFQSFTYPYAINDATEKIQVRYERGFSRRTQNYPHYKGQPVPSREYIPDVIEGYVDTFIKLKKNHTDIVEYIKNHINIKPRYLVRTTAYYLLVINKIISPNISLNTEEKLPMLIDDFLRYPGAHPKFSDLISYETDCLLKYDIPIFHIDVNSRSLFDGNLNEFPDFFPITPIEQINKYFSRNEDYLQRQQELISRSMNIAYDAA